MGYALFAQRKVELTGHLNSLQLQQTQRSNEQYQLATDTLTLQQVMSEIQADQSNALADKYAQLLSCSTESQRDYVNDQISALENAYQGALNEINRQIYMTSVKENTVEMAVKRLDTMVTSVQKQLDAVEEAEGNGIDKATPKFKGIG